MRQAYAYDAVLVMPPPADEHSPGAAITKTLRGHGEPPHHTEATREGDHVRLRVLFAVPPDRVSQVHGAIDAALATGDWSLVSAGCAAVGPAERDHARRLLRSR